MNETITTVHSSSAGCVHSQLMDVRVRTRLVVLVVGATMSWTYFQGTPAQGVAK